MDKERPKAALYMGSLYLGQQALFSLDLLNGCDILGDLQRTEIFTLFVPDSIVAYQDILRPHMDPKIFVALFTGLKIAEDALHNMHACGRMAVFHIASDDGVGAGENAFRVL